MDISTKINDNTLTISVAGKFDFHALQQFRNSYTEVETKPESYIVDFAQTSDVDSAALGMLLALRDFAGGDDAKVQLINCNQNITKALSLTKLTELFKVE